MIAALTDHAGWMRSVAWSADGALLATVDSAGLVIVRDGDLREVTSVQLQPSECLVWGGELIAVGQSGGPALLALCDPADLSG